MSLLWEKGSASPGVSFSVGEYWIKGWMQLKVALALGSLIWLCAGPLHALQACKQPWNASLTSDVIIMVPRRDSAPKLPLISRLTVIELSAT